MSGLRVAAGDVLFHARTDLGGDPVQLSIASPIDLCRNPGIRPEKQQALKSPNQQRGLLDPIGGDFALVDREKLLNGKRKTENGELFLDRQF